MEMKSWKNGKMENKKLGKLLVSADENFSLLRLLGNQCE
jgi:hypothetical protein